MSADFDTKLVYDSRLNDVSDKVEISVNRGSSNLTYQEFRYNSKSESNISFTINPPSESTVIDRHMLLRSGVEFEILATNITPGQSAFSYGLRDSFQSFPFNRLINTSTLSINNVSTSVNQNHVMSALLRQIEPDFLQKTQGTTPSYLDNYGNLSEAVGKANSPMGDYGSSGYDCFLQPRGSHPLDSVTITRTPNGGGPADASPISANLGDSFVIKVKATFTESLLISPCVFGDPKYNESGFLGINNFQLVLNMDSTLSRFWSTGLVGGDYSLRLTTGAGGGFQDPMLLLNFLTSPIDLLLPPKAALPYSSYVAYVTNTNKNLVARVPATAVSPAITSKASASINSLQLEVIPSKLMVFVRIPLSASNARTSDSFLTIKKVRCTFANRSGILSNANQEQLYHLSKKNGCKMSWSDFKGVANKYTSVAPYINEYATSGSLLILDPIYDFGISSSAFLSSSSVGQFNFQMELDFENQLGVDVNGAEIVVIAMRDGVIVTSAGTSSITTNLLNSSIVTQTIEQSKGSEGSSMNKRMIGGMGGVADNPSCSGGMSTSGGAKSGGASSGGMRSKLASLAM